MNRIYRLVWNRTLGVLQVASEFTRGRTKGGRKASGGTRRIAWLAGAPLSLPLLALAAAPAANIATTAAAPVFTTNVATNALPTGGRVTSGSGQLAQQGNTLTVTQQSQNLSLDWQTFNIGSQSTVDFVQPGASAIAVNRIADTNGSQIFGHLNANGQVFLINPNGILFGKGAQVNVGGLVASTLDVDDSALGSSSLTFSGTGKGSVTNLGTIHVSGGGYAALLGNQVGNQGAIHAQLGSVALAGGSAVTLNFGGNKLVSVQVDKSALDALARNGQLIEANGGNVWMTAGARDSLLASAVNNTGTIEAQTVQNRNGHIVLMGGMDAGSVTVGGTLDAGAPNGGSGGEIETSAAQVNVADSARITTAALLGLSGTWLIDPHDFTIAPTGGSITGATLSTQLAGGSIVIQSSAGTAGGSGNINVNDNVSWSAHTLTLTAANNVNVNATMTASGTAGLIVNTATANGLDSAVAGGTLNMGLNGNGFAGQVNFTGAGNSLTINGTPYTIITGLGVAGDASTTTLQGVKNNLTGNYALGANINASGTSAWNSGAGFTPIGGGNAGTAFSGVFEGLGHAITGLYVNYSPTGTTVGVGLFGASSGTIRNVGVSGSVSTGGVGTSVGGLVGANFGTIRNAYSTASVNGTGGGNWIGGLVGCNGCDGFGDTTANPGSGGHTVTGGTITSAFATGSVHGSSYTVSIGGLAGTNYGSISNAYASGAVSGSYGGANPASDNIGGLVGNNWDSITNAYATGSVSFNASSSGNGNFIGGLVGLDSNQTVTTTGTITNTYATGHVSSSDSNDSLGGVIGSFQGGTVTSSYWNTATTGQSSGTGSGSTATTTGTASLSTTQMEQANNFSGWNIATTGGQGLTWRIYSGYSTPLLGSLLVPLTLNASSGSATVTYNGTDQSTAAFNASLASPNFSTVTGVTTTPAQNVGTYSESLASTVYTTQQSYDLSINGTGTVALTVNPATLTYTANIGSSTYGTAASGLSGTVTGFVAGQTLASATTGTLAWNTPATASSSVGQYAINGSGLAANNGNYVFVQAAGNAAALTANPAPLSVTANNASKTYDGLAWNGGNGVVYSGFVNGDTATTLGGSPTYAGSSQGAVNAGAYTIVPGGLSWSNYAITYHSGTLTVAPKTLVASLTGSVSKTYDGTAAAALAAGNYLLSGIVGSDAVTLNDPTVGTYASLHAGTGITVTANGLALGGAAAGNYTLGGVTSANGAIGAITPAPLTVSLSNTTNVFKTYDSTTAAPGGFTPTYSIAGLVSGDSATLSSSATPVFNSAHVSWATAITQGGLSLTSVTGNGSDNSMLSDYVLSSTTAATGNGVAAIFPIMLTATAPTIGGVTTKVYDGTTMATGALLSGGSISGALSGDSLSLDTSGITLAYNSSHAASASRIAASGFLGLNLVTSTNGSQATDYGLALPTIAAVAGTITPAVLTPTLTNSGVTKVYDGTAAAPAGFTPTYSLIGLVSGDTGASLAYSGVAYDSAHVASATSITVSGLGISGVTGSNGSQASDYTLASSTANVAATITPVMLTPTLTNTGVTKTYDGTTAAPAGFTPTYSLTGLVSGDTGASLTDSGVAYNSAHVASATSVAVFGLGLSGITGSNGSLASDYTLASGSANVAATIVPATLTATLTNSGVTKTYDGTTAAPAGFIPTYGFTGLVSGDTGASLTSTGIAYDSAHVASATGITVTGLSVGGVIGSNGSQATDYTLASSSANVAAAIMPAPVTVSLSNTTNVTKTYDGTTATPAGFSPTYTLTGLISGDSATVTSAATPAFNSAHVASATAITQGGLSLASVTGNGTDNSVLGDYTLSSTIAATGNGIAGISPLMLTATAPTIGGMLTKVYDGTTAATGAILAGGGISGALNGDSLLLDTSGVTLAYNSAHVPSASSIGASGSLAVDILGSTNGSQSTDYSVALPSIAPVPGTITPAPLTATLTNSGVTKTYDGTAAAPAGFIPAYSFIGLASGDTGATLTDTGAAYDSAHAAGATKVTVSGLGISGIAGSDGSQASDYTLLSTTADVAATITPATLTATLTNSGVTKTYDGTTAAPIGFIPTYSLAGLVSGDTGANLSDTGAVYNSAQVTGATGITVSGLGIVGIAGNVGSLASDYSLASGSIGVAAAITPAALTAHLTGPISKVYDGTTLATLASTNYTLGGFVNGQGATVTQTHGTYNNSNVAGATTVTATLGSGDFAADGGTDLSNYTLPTSATGVAGITPASLAVTANNANKTYDGVAYGGGNGVSYSGFVNGENASVLGGTLAYSGSSQGATNVGTYVLTPGGLSSGNYAITYGNGTLRVNPATLTASLIGTTGKVYDGTTTATLTAGNYTLTGVIGNDAVSLNDPASGTYATANAGSGIGVEVIGLTIGGAAAGNYVLGNSTATAAIGTITPAALTVSANNASAIYNAHAYSGGNGVSYDGFVDGQNATVLGGTLTYSGNAQGALNVGSYTLTPAGLSSNNYAITYDSGTLAIAPATLTYVATPAQIYAGQAIPPLTGMVSGFQGGDTLANATTGTLTFATPATAQNAAGKYAIDGSGLTADHGNYTFVQAMGNATAFTVATNGAVALPVTAYLQQLLGQPAPGVAALPSGGLMVSTLAAPNGPATVPSQSASSTGAPDLYSPDVRVVGGGVRLP